MPPPYLDTFTVWLRYVIMAGLALVFLFVVSCIVGGAILKRYRRWRLDHFERVWDWEIDGECEREDDPEWVQRTHVHILDTVPKEWMEQWR